MRTSRLFSVALLLSALLPLQVEKVFAGDGGSAYSLLGIGDLRFSSDARSAGMGFTGIGLPGAGYINGLSPAAWTRINRTRIEAGLLYEGFNSTDGVSSRYLAKVDFNGAMLAFPVSQANGIVIGLGITPYSKVNYDTYTHSSYPPDTLDYAVHHVGSGGLSKAQLGASYAPSPSLAFGLSINYLFGTINSSSGLIPTSSSFAGGTVTESMTARGLTFTLGGIYTGFGDLTEALRPLALGFVITSRAALHTSYKNTYAFAAERDTSGEAAGDLVVPLAYGFGLAWQAGEQFVFAADYFAQPWRTSEINGSAPLGIRNMSRVGIGMERLPARELSASWLEKCSYRLGFYYTPTYYDINGQAINEWGATAGLALPVSGENRLNLAVEYGSRGTTEGGLIKDKIVRFVVSVHMSELWFVRYEEE